MAKPYGTPGPRLLHPSICSSESVAACALEAQLLFDRLIVQADDQGRLEGSARRIRGVCLPLADVTVDQVEGWLAELEANGSITRYEADGKALIQITGWDRWQLPTMRRAYPSRWPPPPGWTDRVFGLAKTADDTPLVPSNEPPVPENTPQNAAGSTEHAASRAGAYRSVPFPSDPSRPIPPRAPARQKRSSSKKTNGAGVAARSELKPDDPTDEQLVASLRRTAQESRDPLIAANARQRLERMGVAL